MVKFTGLVPKLGLWSMKVVAKMPDQKDYSGMAALTICEALLLALNEHEVLPEYEILGILHDAAATHESAASPEADKECIWRFRN